MWGGEDLFFGPGGKVVYLDLPTGQVFEVSVRRG